MSKKAQRHAAKGSKKKAVIIIVISVIVVFGIAGAIFYNWYDQKVSDTINIDTFYDGIYIQDIDMSGKTKDEALQLVKATEESQKDNIDITVLANSQEFTLTNNDVNFVFDTEDVVDRAYSYARDGVNFDRYKKVKALQEEPKYYYVSHSIPTENDKLQSYVSNVAEQVHVEKKSPYVSEFNPGSDNPFVYHDGENGIDINSDKLKTDLLNQLQSNNFITTVQAEINTTPFTGSINDLPSQTVLLSTFSTTSTNNANGNQNMSKALSSVNGSIVRKGETFSFNKKTGNTTLTSNGYLPAGAISVDGTFTDEVGGGICQAATTVYGAAMRADMNITSRVCHMYPSTYVPIGQDATVDYPGTDFQFKNDSGYDIFISAGMSGTTLTVSIYGYHPTEWDNIDVTSQTTSTIPPPSAQYINDPTLPAGTQKVKQEAHTGYTAVGQKIFYKNGEVIKSEEIAPSYYTEKGTIILVGTGGTQSDTQAETNNTQTEQQSENSQQNESEQPTENSQPADTQNTIQVVPETGSNAITIQ